MIALREYQGAYRVYNFIFRFHKDAIGFCEAIELYQSRKGYHPARRNSALLRMAKAWNFSRIENGEES